MIPKSLPEQTLTTDVDSGIVCCTVCGSQQKWNTMSSQSTNLHRLQMHAETHLPTVWHCPFCNLESSFRSSIYHHITRKHTTEPWLDPILTVSEQDYRQMLSDKKIECFPGLFTPEKELSSNTKRNNLDPPQRSRPKLAAKRLARSVKMPKLRGKKEREINLGSAGSIPVDSDSLRCSQDACSFVLYWNSSYTASLNHQRLLAHATTHLPPYFKCVSCDHHSRQRGSLLNHLVSVHGSTMAEAKAANLLTIELEHHKRLVNQKAAECFPVFFNSGIVDVVMPKNKGKVGRPRKYPPKLESSELKESAKSKHDRFSWSNRPVSNPEPESVISKPKRKRGRPRKIVETTPANLYAMNAESQEDPFSWSDLAVSIPETSVVCKPKRKRGRPRKIVENVVEDAEPEKEEAECQFSSPTGSNVSSEFTERIRSPKIEVADLNFLHQDRNSEPESNCTDQNFQDIDRNDTFESGHGDVQTAIETVKEEPQYE